MGIPTSGTVRTGPVQRALALLEVVADRGGASAKEVAEALDLPLPSVYRLAKELVEADYLTHVKTAGRFELGTKLPELPGDAAPGDPGQLFGQGIRLREGVGGQGHHAMAFDVVIAFFRGQVGQQQFAEGGGEGGFVEAESHRLQSGAAG